MYIAILTLIKATIESLGFFLILIKRIFKKNTKTFILQRLLPFSSIPNKFSTSQ